MLNTAHCFLSRCILFLQTLFELTGHLTGYIGPDACYQIVTGIWTWSECSSLQLNESSQKLICQFASLGPLGGFRIYPEIPQHKPTPDNGPNEDHKNADQ